MKMLRGLMNLIRYSLWLLAFMLVAMGALAALLPSYPSQAKYVLTPITYTINLSSYTTVPITAIGPITGIPRVQETLTVGALTPSEATATYQWLRSTTSDGTYENVGLATASTTYTLTPGDLDYYFKVQATGTGIYTGTVTSESVGPVMPRTISNPAIDGVTVPLTGATAVTSLPETVEYTATISWSPVPSGGIFQAATQYTATITITPKSGYTLDGVSENFFTVSGATTTNPANSGLVTALFPSTSAIPLTSVVISGTPQVGQTLTAVLTPSGATATYQWQWSSDQNGTYSDISGATSTSYILSVADYQHWIRVQATGTGSYSGTVSSTPVGPVSTIPLTSVAISGTTQFGQTLTAVLTPSGATATYQWQRSTTVGGTYIDISGATSNTYLLSMSDINYFIKVAATGTGSYSGTVTSTPVGPVELKPISIAAISGVTIPSVGATASTAITPNAEYSGTIAWSPALVNGLFASNTVYTATITITPNTGYTLNGVPANFFSVAGATSVTNSANSGVITAVFPSTVIPITAIGNITGTTQVGYTLTAGAVIPAGATVNYQWQRSPSASGPFNAISGATSNTYILTGADANQYIRVTATGTGSYSGTVFSAPVGPVSPETVVTISTITGITVPVKNTVPDYSMDPNSQYSGVITWQGLKPNGEFAANGTYIATITITVLPGYTLTGLPANFFTVSGAVNTTSIINSATSATVTATY